MTEEMMQQAKQCKSAEELLELAKENGIELGAEEATAYFAALHNEGAMSDEELDAASGGGCFNKPKLAEGTVVKWSGRNAVHAEGCSRPSLFEVVEIQKHYNLYGTIERVTVKCTVCGCHSKDIRPSDLYNI